MILSLKIEKFYKNSHKLGSNATELTQLNFCYLIWHVTCAMVVSYKDSDEQITNYRVANIVTF